MKKKILFTLICLFIVRAFSAQELNFKVLDVDTTYFPRVQANFIAFENKAQMIKDLSKNDIQLFEDKKNYTDFDLDYIKNNNKIRLAIALDISGSMRGAKFENAKIAIKNLLNVVDTNDQCALIFFGSEVQHISNFTSDFPFILDAINKIDFSNKTRLYDGLLESTKLFSAFEPTRNAIILVTDGKDEGSLIDLQTVLNLANRNNVEIYSIGVGKGTDLDVLGNLSLSTKSGFFGNYEPAEIRFIFQNIYELLTKNYQVSFFTSDSIVELSSTKRNLGLVLNYNDRRITDEIEYSVPKYNPVKKQYWQYLIFILPLLLFVIVLIVIINKLREKNKKNDPYLYIETEEPQETQEMTDDDFVDFPQTDGTTLEDDWEGEFSKNIQEQKTVLVNKGKFRTKDSLGYLIMRSKKLGTYVYEIKQKELIIGRGAESDILIEDEQVSKSHTKVRVVDGIFYIDDLGSSNGTFINGEESYHSELKDGDIIKIAEHEFIFKCIE